MKNSFAESFSSGPPELSIASVGKAGWPWTENIPAPPPTLASGAPWPRISVITPSFNQDKFIEQTIRSVLFQNYPNLEYIVIDGGSTDGSVEIIRKYEKHLAHWESETDRGQSHAINKGFERATGEILCWLNSDDYYLPDTLCTVAETLAAGTGNLALVGNMLQTYDDGTPSVECRGHYENLDRLLQFWKGYQMHQPSIFWRREVFDRVGYLDESLHLTMDFDYWVRIARQSDFVNLNRVLSCATYHRDAKTGDGFASYSQELVRRAPRYWPRIPSPAHYRLRLSMLTHVVLIPHARRLRALARYYPKRAWSLLAGTIAPHASKN